MDGLFSYLMTQVCPKKKKAKVPLGGFISFNRGVLLFCILTGVLIKMLKMHEHIYCIVPRR